MAAPPTQIPPPPQSHQEEQSENDSLRTNITFRQPQPYSLSPLSGQNPETVGSAAAAAVGATAESSKKRGRPRKAPADGNTGAAGAAAASSSSSKKPSKKVQERTPGSGKMHQQPEASGAVGLGSMRHIPVRIGEDIVSRVTSSLEQGAPAVTVLSATGSVRDVTLRQSATGGTVTHEGEFPILSLSGMLRSSETNGSRDILGHLNVFLLGPDSKALSGIVVGTLTAASPVQMFVSC